MKFTLCILVVLVATLFSAEAKKKSDDSTPRDDGDFEFVNEVSKKPLDPLPLRPLSPPSPACRSSSEKNSTVEISKMAVLQLIRIAFIFSVAVVDIYQHLPPLR